MKSCKTILLTLTTSLAATAATAQVAEECREPQFSDVGWTDITATTSMAEIILESLGYEPGIRVLSVPVTFEALQGGDIDIFLGNWMPLHEPIQVPLVEEGKIEVVQTILEGARVGLATTTATAEQGLTSYDDISEFADELGEAIYGIEAGSSANTTIIEMIENDKFALGEFELVESSEQGMLGQVRRLADNEEPVVFFGWRPHPMNVNMDLTYLTGSDDVFGPNEGAATVHTVTRPGLTEECPNLGTFLENYVFEVSELDVMMDYILTEGMSAEEAVRKWMSENPGRVEQFVEGTTTAEGEPAWPAVKEDLEL